MTVMVELNGQEPIAFGGKRLIYRHPDDPSLIIKVMRPENRPSRDQGALVRSRARYHSRTPVRREVREYLANAGGTWPICVARFRGLVETSFGRGVVAEAVYGPDGALAPTLQELITKRAHYSWQALERFCADIMACPVVVGDLNLKNIVYAQCPENGPYFTVVDGLGDKTLIPLLRWSSRLNRYAKRRQLARIVDLCRRAHPEQRPDAPMENARSA